MRNRFVLVLLLATVAVLSARLSDVPVRSTSVATPTDSRSSQLIGFGLVTGLDGTGSKSTFTQQVVADVLHRVGVSDSPHAQDSVFQLGSASAVMVVAEFAPHASRGGRLDVTVSAIDDSSSLIGGTLLMTSLKGPNGVVYAQAQGGLSRDAQTKTWRIRGGAVMTTGLMGANAFVSTRAR